MVVDGVELLRMIRDGELKQDQEMIDINKNKRYYFDGECIMEKEEFEALLSNISDVSFSKMKFRILSAEDEEKNIEEITGVNGFKLMESPYMAKCLKEGKFDTFTELLKQSELEFVDKIDELIKAIKQINRKLGK